MRERRRQRELREEQQRQEKKGKRKKRRWLLAIGLPVLLICLAAGGYVVYDRVMDSRTMGCRISVFGENVSWLTTTEATQKLAETFGDTKVEFKENGTVVYRTTLKETGYELDQTHMLERLTQLKAKQEPCKILFEEMKNFTVDYQTSALEDAGKAVASAAKAAAGGEREASKDAYIIYNEEAEKYEIVPDEVGTEIDAERLQKTVQKTVEEAVQKKLLNGTITVEIGEETYARADVTKDQPELVEELEQLNGRLQGYLDATITYTFGETTDTLDSDTIRSWIQVDGKEITLNEDAIWEYVSNLGLKYNTMYVPRFLETSDGGTVEISNNEYGYWLDEEGEFAQIMADLDAGVPVTREPVYSKSGLGRNGDDDLLGSYVEISLEKQHLWFYKDGELLTDTDVITGKPEGLNKKTGEKEDWSTYKGAYPLAYKESPSKLTSDIYGYDVEVQYWMPFVYGQGLHDASWQSAFGGQTYLTNGSHGCVNLPPSEAKIIYENIEAGYPILIY